MNLWRLCLAAVLMTGAAGAAITPGPEPEAAPEMLTPVGDVGESVNFLPNSSFERSIGSAAPEYWSRFGEYLPACPDWTVVEQEAFDGGKCLRGAPGQTLSIPAETASLPADEYVFSVYLKAAEPGARCRLALRARPDVDDGRSPWQAWDKTVELTTAWERYELAVKIDRHMEYNRWGIMGGLFACEVTPLSPGILVDAAQLEQAESASEYVPSAGQTRVELPPWPEKDRLQVICEDLQRKPASAPDRSERGGLKVYVSRPEGLEQGTHLASGGILLPRGALFDRDGARLLAPSGERVAMQTEVLARHGLDASIRSLYVTFPADLSIPEDAPYTLECNEQSHVDHRVRVRETDDAVEVVTGPLKIALDRREFRLFDGVWLDADGDGRFADAERLVAAEAEAGLSLVDDAGAVWDAALHRPLVVVERSGPFEAVVRIQGWHASPDGRGHLGYTVRIHAYDGKPYVKVEHTFTNLDQVRTTQLRSLSVRVPFAGGGGHWRNQCGFSRRVRRAASR